MSSSTPVSYKTHTINLSWVAANSATLSVKVGYPGHTRPDCVFETLAEASKVLGLNDSGIIDAIAHKRPMTTLFPLEYAQAGEYPACPSNKTQPLHAKTRLESSRSAFAPRNEPIYTLKKLKPAGPSQAVYVLVKDDRPNSTWDLPEDATRDPEVPEIFSFTSRNKAVPSVGATEVVAKQRKPMEYTLVSPDRSERITVVLSLDRHTIMDTAEHVQFERYPKKPDWFVRP